MAKFVFRPGLFVIQDDGPLAVISKGFGINRPEPLDQIRLTGDEQGRAFVGLGEAINADRRSALGR